MRTLKFTKHVKLSSKIFRSVRNNLFSNLKSKRQIDSVINSSGLMVCRNCDFKCKVKTNGMDLRRTALHLINNPNSLAGGHLAAFPDHSIDEKLRRMKQYGSKYECDLMA